MSRTEPKRPGTVPAAKRAGARARTGNEVAARIAPATSGLAYGDRERSLGTRTQQLVHQLGVAVVTGAFGESGQFPIEAEICSRFGASRSIVREAVKVLNAKGLLTAKPRRGTQVRPEREWNLLDPDVLNWILQRRFNLPLLVDFTRTRLAIEPLAAAEAARTASREQCAAIRAAVEGLVAATKGAADPLEADIQFHLTVLEASNNRFLQNMQSVIETALRFSIRYQNRQLKRQFALVEDHQAISDAILERNPPRAEAAARTLLLAALATMVDQQGRLRRADTADE